MLRDQAVLHSVAYVVLLPLALLIFVAGILPWAVAGWFYVLLVTEHAGKELNRLLIVAGRPVMATTAQFVQRGGWALAIPILMLTWESLRTLDVVFAAWALSSFIAVAFSAWGLRHLERGSARPVDWPWIRKGLKVAAVFLVGALFQRGVFTLDRYILEGAGGLDLVGVYTFFMGIAMAAIAFLDAGVFAFLYPRVVSAFNSGVTSEFTAEMRRLLVRTVLATGTLVAGAAVLIHPVLRLLDRPLYTENAGVFWILLGAVGIFALAMVPHFGLYAMGRDRTLLASRSVAFFAFLATALVVSSANPLMGVGAGVLAGCGTLGLVNLGAYIACRPSAEA
jgi:O-antigen/teichoic acid export membrane protein